MIIATFGPTTGWAGKAITREGEVFTLEGHGPITAADVMEYDRQGQLVWANDGARAWVGAKARTPNPQVTSAQTSRPGSARAGGDSGSRSGSGLLRALTDHVLVVTVVVVAVVVIVGVLGVAGVFGSRGAVEDKTTAGATASPSASPSIAQDTPWPKRLAGSWMGSNGARITIGESADGAIITLVTTDGYVLNWKFSGETFVVDTPSPGHVPLGPFGRTQASTSPYTGIYTWSANNFYGSPLVTAQVTFHDDTLTINITNSSGSPGLTQLTSYSLSPGGNTLVVSAGTGGGVAFARQ